MWRVWFGRGRGTGRSSNPPPRHFDPSRCRAWRRRAERRTEVKLSDAWMIFVFLALTMYIVLDGYDLGIGVLTLIDRDPSRRREMQSLVAWTWDGNESWLVLLALTLWAGLPLVTGVALPALYIPLVLMLWALIARGVALELIDQHDGWHPFWGPLFGIGSLVAAFCQGA